MNILRGTFRLSILVGLITFGYRYWEADKFARQSVASSYELWSTLRCGRSLLGKDTKPYENEYGLIDLGKYGCSHRRFLARTDEIEAALREEEPARGVMEREMKWQWRGVLSDTVAAFVFVNLLGLVFLGLRAAYRWVAAGFSAR